MGWRSRTSKLTRELGSHPFLPILFIGETIKTANTHALAGQPSFDVVVGHTVAAIFSIVIWLYLYEDVAWGLQQVENTVEDVTEN